MPGYGMREVSGTVSGGLIRMLVWAGRVPALAYALVLFVGMCCLVGGLALGREFAGLVYRRSAKGRKPKPRSG